MDETTLLELLVNGSPLAAFAGYLVYQTKGLQKRMDMLNDKATEREDNLRSRYDKVINDLTTEKNVLQQQQQYALDQLEKKVDALVTSVDNISQVVQELRMKEIARNVNNASQT